MLVFLGKLPLLLDAEASRRPQVEDRQGQDGHDHQQDRQPVEDGAGGVLDFLIDHRRIHRAGFQRLVIQPQGPNQRPPRATS